MKICAVILIGIHIVSAFVQQSLSVSSKNPFHESSFELPAPTQFDRSWYVVAHSNEIKPSKPFKVTVWGKDYVLWKTDKNTYNALEDVCSHKGAALSIGHIANDHIVCPYHGYEFSNQGNLTLVPGICFRPSPIQNIPRFAVVEKHGWIYLNTHELPQFVTKEHIQELARKIFVEPEATDPQMTPILLDETFMTYPRIVSENSLDIMHIAFVHTFGNRAKPAPTYENPPKEVGPDHWRTTYIYESGKDSMVSRFFKMKRIDIDTEFALPHTTIALIKFGTGLVNTVVTAACPVNERETRLFVKTYRNFFRETFFNDWFKPMMAETLNQDKGVIESIKNENMDGRFNLKYDKLQNTYRTLYKRLIRNN